MAIFGRPTAADHRREAAYRQWFARQHPLALTSLIISVFSLTHFGTLWFDEVLGIVLGIAALRQLRRPRADGRQGTKLAASGIAVGVLSMICAVVVYFVLPRGG